MTKLADETMRRNAESKVPAVTLGFWIIKIAATTLGETGGDAATMSLHLGYLVGTAIFAVVFVALVGAQITAKRFHPFLFWAVIVATTTLGTTMADFFDRSLGIDYPGGAFVLFLLLMASLAVWYWSTGSVSVSTIRTRKVEMLGTAFGDWVAATDRQGLGLGYEYGALIFLIGLAIVSALYFFTSVSRVLLFWSAFILTRPLGATVGDFLDKPVAHGGLALNRFTASAVLAAFIITAILVLPQKVEKQPAAQEDT
jgi:uncharacterized membrane-anchored protein